MTRNELIKAGVLKPAPGRMPAVANPRALAARQSESPRVVRALAILAATLRRPA